MMPPVENRFSKLTYIHFLLHMFGAVIPVVTGGNRCGSGDSFQRRVMGFTGMTSTGLVAGWVLSSCPATLCHPPVKCGPAC